MNQYSMLVQWSEDDQLFLVTIPEFAERVFMPCTHGKTRAEAISNGEDVVAMYLEAWEAEGEAIPQPRAA
jgi:antitoxin HicB